MRYVRYEVKEPYERDDILQERHIIRALLQMGRLLEIVGLFCRI